MGADFKYWAFISYSHTDKKWGDWLHKALETYKVPKALVGSVTLRGEIAPERVYPIFRDREELPTNDDLGVMIHSALERSRYLIIICSPRSAQSQWVDKEILEFKRLGRENRVLAIIVEGEPNASDGKPGVNPAAECFPPALRFKLGADGRISSERTEPIAADARERGDGKLNSLLKLLAGVMGVNYNDLKRRDEVRRRRQQRLVIAVIVALMLTFATLAGAALWQRNVANQETRVAEQQKQEAIAQKEIAQATLARSDYLQAVALMGQEKYNEALPFLARSLRVKPHANPAASLAFDLLMRQPMLLAVLHGNQGPYAIDAKFSPDGSEVMMTSGPTVQLLDSQTGQLIAPPIEHAGSVSKSIFSPDGSRVVTVWRDAKSGTSARIWNAKTGKAATPSLSIKYDFDPYGDFIEFSTQGNELIASSATHSSSLSVTTNNESAVQAWDTKTGREITLPFLKDSTRFISFSPDGRLVATDSPAASSTVWSLKTGLPILPPLSAPDGAGPGEFSPDSTRFLTLGGSDRVWDLKTGSVLTETSSLGEPSESASFSADGNRIQMVGGYLDDHSDRVSIKVWDIKSGKPWGEPPPNASFNSKPAFSPEGNRVATVSSDNEASVWDFQNGKAITPPLKHTNYIVSIGFSPGGERVATASFDRTARVWDAVSGDPLTLPLQHEDIVRTACFSPDGAKVLTTSDDGTVRLWDVRTGQPVDSWLEHGHRASQISFSRDGARELIVSGGNPQVWDFRTGRLMWSAPQSGQSCSSATFSADGKLVLTLSDDKSARVWDVEGGQPVSPPIPTGDFAGNGTFSPDGTCVFITWDGKDEQNVGQIFSVRTGQAIGSLMKFNGLDSAVFSFDGKTLTTSGGIFRNEVAVWDAHTGLPAYATVGLEESKNYVLTALSPDGMLILSAVASWDARIINAKTGQPVASPLHHHDWVTGGGFSADGRLAVTRSADGMTRVWNVKTGQPIAPPFVSKGGGRSIAFSPDGNRLVITGSDALQVWDSTTGEPLTALMNVSRGSKGILSASFTPDGMHLIVEAGDHSFRLKDLSPVSDSPAWLSDLLEAAAFSRLNDQGILESVSPERILEMKRARLASTAGDSWEVFGRWLFTDPTARTVSPWNSTSMPEYVQELISLDEPDSLRHAIELSYGHPDWQAQAKATLLKDWPGAP